MAEYTDEQRADIVARYKKANPTPTTSVEIVKEIAEALNITPNGVRAILVKADAYIKKDATTTKTATGEKSTGTRVSKTAAMADLTNVIKANSLDVDEEILGKLTGKAAVYFTNLLKELANRD